MIEAMYPAPIDLFRERSIVELAKQHGGEVSFREAPKSESDSQAICLTIEFQNETGARETALELRQLGVHVEGPMSY